MLRFGDIGSVMAAERCAISALAGERTAILLTSIRHATLRSLKARIEDRPLIATVQHVLDYISARLAGLRVERILILFLTGQMRLITDEFISSGTIDQAQLYLRAALTRALELGAQGLIIAHNHPGGTLEPSAADRELTRCLIEAARPLDIRVLDHVIVSRAGVTSFRRSNLL